MKDPSGETHPELESDGIPIPVSLRRQWRTALLLCLALVTGFAAILNHGGQADMVRRWLLSSVPVVAYVLAILRLALRRNHRPDESALLHTLGPGTWVSLLRGVLIGWLAGFLFFPWPLGTNGASWLGWVPGLLYLLAASADFLDGLLARLSAHETRLGEILDTKIDALGLVIAPLVGIRCGQLPVYYISVSAAYYLFTLGVWIRKKRGKPVFVLKPRPAARLAAGFQMGLVGTALLPVLGPPATTLAATLFMIPFLLGFSKDWLSVCGYSKPDAFRQSGWHVIWGKKLASWLPPVVRLVLLGAGILTVHRVPAISKAISGHSAVGLSLRQAVIVFSFFMLVCGITGRIAAVILSLSAGRILTVSPVCPELTVLLACCLILLLTGTGSLSVWQPEDEFLFEKAGRRKNPGQ